MLAACRRLCAGRGCQCAALQQRALELQELQASSRAAPPPPPPPPSTLCCRQQQQSSGMWSSAGPALRQSLLQSTGKSCWRAPLWQLRLQQALRLLPAALPVAPSLPRATCSLASTWCCLQALSAESAPLGQLHRLQHTLGALLHWQQQLQEQALRLRLRLRLLLALQPAAAPPPAPPACSSSPAGMRSSSTCRCVLQREQQQQPRAAVAVAVAVAVAAAQQQQLQRTP